MRWSSRPARPRSTWGCRPSRSSGAAASPPARPATGSSSGTSASRSSAAATRPSRKRCTSPTSPRTSRSCIGATRCAPKRSCRTTCSSASAPARSISSGTTTVDEVLGDDNGVTGLRVAATGGAGKRDIDVTGVFIAVGHAPNTQLFEGQLEMKGGYIIVRSGSLGGATRPACRACSPPATSPIMSTGRRSRRPARAAWRRSTPTSIWTTWMPAPPTEAARMTRGARRAPESGSPRTDRGHARGEWNALDASGHPFVRHEFLAALEDDRLRRRRTGWLPAHLVVLENARISWWRPCPLYRKTHSWGEFVFDWSWAQAYMRAGLEYYPKLAASRSRRSTGPALWLGHSISVRSSARRRRASRSQRLRCGSNWRRCCRKSRSARARPPRTCCSPSTNDQAALERAGFLRRKDCQFHWRNRGYATSTSSSRRFAPTSARRRCASGAGRRSRHRVPHAARRGDRRRTWDVIFGFSARTFLRTATSTT